MRLGVVTATEEGDDGVVVACLRRLRPDAEVVVYRPDPVAGDNAVAVLGDCDAVYLLDARGGLPEHRYPLYRRLFHELAPVADRVVPSLATMQFVWSKAEVFRLMDAHGIPHPPTFVLERVDPRAAVDGMVAWLETLRRSGHPPRWIVTKPSHATNCQDVQEWDLEYVSGDPAGAARFVAYLRRLFEEQGKPYVLVQPRIHALRYGPEYRHVFVDGAFHACAVTAWKRVPRTDDEWRCVPRNTEDAALLRETVPLASRLVELLPSDSALYRVDLFRHRGAWWVTEVEAVDADTYGDTSVPEPLAQALLARPPGTSPDISAFASLPVTDEGAVGLPDNAWLALERHLYAALRRAFPSCPRPRRRRRVKSTR